MATNGLSHEQEDLTEIYRLIHSFLVAHAHEKAAKAVRKAAKEIRIKGVKKTSHISLENVLQEWQKNKKAVENLKAEVQALTEKLANMRAQSTAAEAKSSSSGGSSSDSSSSESSDDGEGDKKSSDFSSDDDKEGEDKGEDKEPVSRPGIGARSHHPSAQMSPVKVIADPLLRSLPAVPPKVNGRKANHSGDNEDSASSKVTKKRKTNGGSVPTAIAENEAKSNEQSGSNPTKGKTKSGRKSNVPFERIKTDKVVYADDRLKDNTFESRGAGTSDYGAKASADLIVTRGAGFRKEKNKKKRGSYRGGDITMGSHSVKFND